MHARNFGLAAKPSRENPAYRLSEIDEVNFMDIVTRSSRSPEGGGYDQAMALYQSIARRRGSRFMRRGRVPGLAGAPNACVESSTAVLGLVWRLGVVPGRLAGRARPHS